MFCPVCHDEFAPGTSVCPDHHVALVPEGVSITPARRANALLGRFHPDVAPLVVALLQRRNIVHETFDLGDARDEGVEVVIDGEFRDDLRAELVVNWQQLVGELPEEQMYGVLREGGNLPGWRNAPTSSWIDRDGRLQVGFDDEDHEDDANRTLGPALAVLGVFLILLAWYAEANWAPMGYVLGGGAVVAGLLVPR